MFVMYEHILAARKIVHEREVAIDHYVGEGLLKVEDADIFQPVFEHINRLLIEYSPSADLLKCDSYNPAKKRASMSGREILKGTADTLKKPFESLWGLLQDTQKVKKLFKDKAGDELLMLAEQAEDPVAKCRYKRWMSEYLRQPS